VKSTLAVGLLALAALIGGTAVAPVAQAHSELISTDPADGAVLDVPPTTVSFTFNEALLPDFVRFVGTDPNGQTGDLPVSSVDGPTATIDWPAAAPAGEWRVSYRVVSQDGHPVEGGITFTYAGASPTTAPTSAAPTTAAPTSAAPTTAAPSPSTSPAADTSGGTSGIVIAGLAVGIIVIAGIVIALVARRRT
jgi:methionine-rich copper-binding protein CopC